MARTYLVAFGCCCSFLIGFGQAKSVANKFSIRGHIVGKVTGSVILVYSDFKNEVLADTAQLKDGNFYFCGTTNRVCEALLWCDPSNKEFDNPSMVRFLLEPKNIRVRAIKGSEAKAVIDGSESEREKMKWDDRKSQLLNAKVKYRESGDSLYCGLPLKPATCFHSKPSQ